MATVTYSNVYENQFWLQIIGDSARIILRALSPEDTNNVQKIKAFITQFDGLLDQSHQNMSPGRLAQLNQDAFSATYAIQKHFIEILRLQLTSNFQVQLKPSVVNDSITFCEEYMFSLNSFMHNSHPTYDERFQDIFWLPIFSSTAKIITDELGSFQGVLRKRAEFFANSLQELLAFFIELQGLFRIGTLDFPIAKQHRKEVKEILTYFSNYIKELINLVQENRIPGTLTVLFLDRTNRLICYYLTQLSVLHETEKPECDPVALRISTI